MKLKKNIFCLLSGIAILPIAGPSKALSAGGLCQAWEAPVQVGLLDVKALDEESGLAVSRRYNRFYHINDSGDGPYFYVTGRDGSNTQRIEIDDFNPHDVEEVAMGPCPAGGTCVVVADIGDNRKKRKFIELLFIEEKANFPSKVEAVSRVKLEYPDRPHDAEAFAILPSGDIVIVTKEYLRGFKAQPAQIFMVRKIAALAAGPKAKVSLQKIGEIDVPAILEQKGLGGLVTAMSLSGDGKRFLLLTYSRALEFNLDLGAGSVPAPSELKAGRDYNIVSLSPLPQQESISYDINDRDLLYSSETITSVFGGSATTPIMRMRCK